MTFLRFLFDRSLDVLRHDAATFVVLVLTAMCWPFDLVLDVMGVAP